MDPLLRVQRLGSRLRRHLPGVDGAQLRWFEIYIFFGQCFVASSESPVSSRLFRLDKIAGQPVETLAMNVDSGLSISWVMVSFTVSPCGSISMVQRE